MSAGQWPILAGLSAEDRERVTGSMTRRQVAQGTYIFHERDPAPCMFLIERGLVAIECTTSKGLRSTLTVCGPGESFGELALLDGQDPFRSASAVALQQCTLYALHKHDFDELRRRYPFVERVMVELLLSQVKRLTPHLVEALTEDARTRVLRVLCRLAVAFDTEHGFPIRLTLDRVKTMAGVTRRVTDIFRDLESQGVIRRDKGRAIYVPDLARLRREAGLPG